MSPMRPPRQEKLTKWEVTEDDLEELTPAEREVYREIELKGKIGPRELAKQSGRSPGTVGNLLSRAREKLSR